MKHFERLRWEESLSNCVTVQIPVRRRPSNAILSIVCVGWTYISSMYLNGTVAQSGTSYFAECALYFGIVGLLYFTGAFAWSWIGKTVVYLDCSEIRIEQRAFFLKWLLHRFTLDQIDTIQYIPPHSLYRFRIDTDVHASKMELRSGNRAYCFAYFISEKEAYKLLSLLNVSKAAGRLNKNSALPNG